METRREGCRVGGMRGDDESRGDKAMGVGAESEWRGRSQLDANVQSDFGDWPPEAAMTGLLGKSYGLSFKGGGASAG